MDGRIPAPPPTADRATTRQWDAAGAMLEVLISTPASNDAASRGVVLVLPGAGVSGTVAPVAALRSDLLRHDCAVVRMVPLTRAEQAADLASGRWSLDVALTAVRTAAIVDRVSGDPEFVDRPVALCGFGTASATVLAAAAQRACMVAAVACVGGHPERCGARLRQGLERVPTLALPGPGSTNEAASWISDQLSRAS